MPSALAAVPQEFANSTAAGMDEESFRLFYARTARPLRSYLYHSLSDPSLADDILQESYLRLLSAKLPANMAEDHLKNYLFRIAANLTHHPCARSRSTPLIDRPSPASLHDDVAHRHDMQQVLQQLKPRQRELLWLAYVERFSHAEIANVMGAKAESIRPMLARARRTLAALFRPMPSPTHV
jgi:RNA polymerase sigma-70 factor (ECF subfamily)